LATVFVHACVTNRVYILSAEPDVFKSLERPSSKYFSVNPFSFRPPYGNTRFFVFCQIFFSQQLRIFSFW